VISFAIALTRSWTATYTRGLPSDLREERREEIDCDLWKHQRLADLQLAPATGTAVEILLRLVLGIPADVFWRLEAGAGSTRSERGTQVNDTLIMRGLLGIALAVAAFPLVIGFLVMTGLNGETSDTERVVFGPLQVLVGAVIIAGLVISSRRPMLGVGLVIAGTIAISVMWYWAAVITAPIGLGLVAIAYWRARQMGWPEGLRPA